MSDPAASRRALPRYTLQVHTFFKREDGTQTHFEKGPDFYLATDVAPLLTALEAREKDKVLLDLLTTSKSPCGHWGSHAYSPDGKGKQILCLDCENAALTARAEAVEAACRVTDNALRSAILQMQAAGTKRDEALKWLAGISGLVEKWRTQFDELTESAKGDRERSSVGLAQPKEECARTLRNCALEIEAALRAVPSQGAADGKSISSPSQGTEEADRQ